MTAVPQDNVASGGIYLSRFLAWDSIGNERNRNRVLVVLALLLSFGLATWMWSVQVPKVDRATAEKVPERLARVMLEKKLEPPPPPPPKEEKKEEEKKEEPKPEEPKPEKPTDVQVQKAREKAQKAMAEAKQELAAMQDLASSFDMGNSQPLAKGGTSGTGAGVSRDMIGSRAGRGSGGVSLGAVSSGGGGKGLDNGGKLGGAQVAAVQSNISEGPTGKVRKNASGKLERTQEEIRRIMDRNNGALQAIYQRALRNNPTLKGAIVLRLVIAPDGSVTTADIVSSELGDPDTEKKLMLRIKAINFGAIEGVMVWDDKYTLNFFPS